MTAERPLKYSSKMDHSMYHCTQKELRRAVLNCVGIAVPPNVNLRAFAYSRIKRQQMIEAEHQRVRFFLASSVPLPAREEAAAVA